jgi:hypothetical protein
MAPFPPLVRVPPSHLDTNATSFAPRGSRAAYILFVPILYIVKVYIDIQ